MQAETPNPVSMSQVG